MARLNPLNTKIAFHTVPSLDPTGNGWCPGASDTATAQDRDTTTMATPARRMSVTRRRQGIGAASA